MERLVAVILVTVLVGACSLPGGQGSAPTAAPAPLATSTRAATVQVRKPVKPRKVVNTIRGRFVLHGNSNLQYMTRTIDPIGRSGCAGRQGYEDIRNGTQVLVRNDSGRILAKGQLTGGRLREIRELQATCTFSFTIRNVPRSGFYVVEVAQRGELTFSHAEMQAAKWLVGFELNQD